MGATSTPAVVASKPASEADRNFLDQVSRLVLYETEVSRLAANRATTPRVRTYAQWLANRRAQGSSELAALLRSRGVASLNGLPADKATKLQRLAALPPSVDFDRGFVRVVGIEERQSTIALFERTRRTTADRELRAWIDRTLASLRTELTAAQDIAGTLAG
jgi:putative membrane protein